MTQWDELGVVTASGSDTQLVVSGLTQDYDDLHVIFEGFANDGTNPYNNAVVRLNGDSSQANYGTNVMILDGSSTLFQEIDPNAVDGWTVYRLPAVSSGNRSDWGYMSFDIINYTYAGARNCVAQHCTVQQSGGTAMGAMGMSYLGTSAITSVGVYSGAVFGPSSSLTVYGLKNS